MNYSCSINTHGRKQLELNLQYPLIKNSDIARFQLDCYLFTPYQLAVTGKRYGTADFFGDLHSYTRYTVPVIPLDKLTDPSCEISPLAQIAKMLSKSNLASELDEKAMLYELRVLTNIYHDQLTVIRHLLRDKLKEAKTAEDSSVFLLSSLEEIDRFLARFRLLHQDFLDSRISNMLRISLQWTDESISLHTEKFEYRTYQMLSGQPGMDTCRKRLGKRLDREQHYRIQRGYAATIDPGNEIGNELFVYREGILKKWAEACLYLSRLPSSIAANTAQIMMGAAAGIAMAFAVFVTIFASRMFVVESLSWVILIVLAYIAKDRIKDLLRSFLIRIIPSLVADHIENLIDPTLDQKVGVSRSRARFCRPDQIPELVTRLRNMRADVFKNIIPPEDVLHYHKTIRFNSLKIRNHHKRLESLTEIIRLKMDYWFTNMDDPANRLFCMRDEAVTTITANRVYHVNLIVRLTDCNQPGKHQSLFRYRITLTREGILRIEPLDSFPGTM